jgi:hypothetical protein
MWEDPIVAEVHRIRAKMAADCNYDIDAFFKGIMERQAARGVKLVQPPKRAEPATEDESQDEIVPSGSDSAAATAPAA